MKNITLFLLLMCAAISYGQGVLIKDRDSIAYNDFAADDLIGIARPSGGIYSWYRTSFYGLAYGVRNMMLGQSNNWTAVDTFSATIHPSTVLPRTTDAYSLGSGAKRWNNIWAKYGHIQQLNLPNPEGNDSLVITYDDSTLTFSKNITITPFDSSGSGLGDADKPFRSVNTDSVISNQRLHLSAPNGVEVTGIFQFTPQLNVAVTNDDSSLIITSNIVELEPSGTAQIDTLYINPNLMSFTPGIEITIYNKTTNPVTFKDDNGANWTNCMRLAGGDVVLNQFDSFKLIYYLNLGIWIQSGAFIDNN
jgi:hypothetical protein